MGGLIKTIAEKATDGDQTAVVVGTECGSIKVKATLDLEERIGIMEGEKEGQDVDLVKEMESLKGEVQKDLGKSNVKNEILTKAKNNKGLQEATSGEISITDVEAEVTAA